MKMQSFSSILKAVKDSTETTILVQTEKPTEYFIVLDDKRVYFKKQRNSRKKYDDTVFCTACIKWCDAVRDETGELYTILDDYIRSSILRKNIEEMDVISVYATRLSVMKERFSYMESFTELVRKMKCVISEMNNIYDFDTFLSCIETIIKMTNDIHEDCTKV